jgi:hypothetical protein
MRRSTRLRQDLCRHLLRLRQDNGQDNVTVPCRHPRDVLATSTGTLAQCVTGR